MKIKLLLLLLLLLLLRVRSKKARGGEQGAERFVGIWVQHGVSQLNVTKTVILVTSSH